MWFVGGEQGVLHGSRTSAAAPGGVPVHGITRGEGGEVRASTEKRNREKEERGTRHDRGRPRIPAERDRALPWHRCAAVACSPSGRRTGEWGARE